MKKSAFRQLRWFLVIVPILITAIILSITIFAGDPTPIRGLANMVNTGATLDFTLTYSSNVTITDPDPGNSNIRTLSGYAWSEDLGWIDFTGVTVVYASGDLVGTASVINTGSILDFDNYNNDASINTTTGQFQGNVWSIDTGWIDMADTGVYVEEIGDPIQPTTLSGYSEGSKALQIQTGTEYYYNYESPYFEWVGATDTVDDSGYTSGVEGYYVYWGTDDTAIPSTHGSAQEDDYFTPPALVSGSTYYLRIQTYDNVGNVYTNAEDDYTFFTYQYDSEDPTNPTGLSSPQTYQNEIENITVYWSTTGATAAQDSVSGVKGYQYKIESGGTWYGSNHSGAQDCSDLVTTGSYTLDSDFDTLSVGESTFYFRTYDNACNVTDTNITAILKYSGIAPTEPQNLQVTPESNTENSFAFSWETPVTYAGQESGLSYCYTVNSVPSSIICNWADSSSLDADSFAIQPSTNTFYVVAKDEAGNVNYSSHASITFVADTPAPSIPLNIDIADVSVKATSSWKLVVSWEEPEDIGVGIEYYQIYHSTDDENFTLEGTTSGISYVIVGLTQEEHFYKVKACDSANNCSAFSSVVGMYPDGKFTEPASVISQPMVTNISTRRATINWVTDRECDTRIQYGIESGEYFDEEIGNSNMLTSHSINLTSLDPETVYYFRSKWMDEDGNVGISNEMSFKTSSMPTVRVSKISKVSLDYAILDMTLVGADMAQVVYGKTSSYGGLQEVNTSPVVSKYSVIISDLEDGITYHYKIRLIDSEGYSYDSIEDHTFTTPPRPSISNVRVEELKGVASPTVTFTWKSNTKITSVINYGEIDGDIEMDQIDLENISGLHSMNLTNLIPETKYYATVEGVDSMGNKAFSDTITFTTATDTRPPVISNARVVGDLISRTIQSEKSRSAQLIVSWETDEPATSRVEYGEGTMGTYSSSTNINSELRTKHSIVLTNLTPSKVYHLKLVSDDIAGNIGEYGPMISITPKSNLTVFESVTISLISIFDFLR
ncbi:TPA: hypothetical protein DEP90_03130 [Patescibacteria group bacterium]|nr:hypothetical protein [Patescibacteria group bacterium]